VTSTRRRQTVLHFVTTWLVSGVVLVACTTSAPRLPSDSSLEDPTPAPTIEPVVTRAPPPAIVGEFDAGGAGWAMTKAGGALWIQVDPPVDAIVRIDVATGSATSAVVAGHGPKSGDEGLWVVGADWLARIDPATGEEMLRVPMGGALALGDGAAWLANESGLHRINP
jgi:hypothetical protein